MSNFKKFSAYADVPCTWVREVIPDDDKVKQLKAKNAKLRAERDEWRRVAESKQDIIDHMRDANAKNKKLLDLVDELWAIAYGYAPDESKLDCARDMMRELGVVPE